MNWVEIASLGATLMLVAGIFLAMPRLTRRSLVFAVTVDPAFRETEAARAIERGYRLRVLAHTALSAALLASAALGAPAILAQAALVWLLVGSLAAFLRARRQTLPHAAPQPTVREAALTPHDHRLPFSRRLLAGPYVILGATAAALAARWDQMGPRVPTHWDALGRPDAFAERTLFTVFGPILLWATGCLLLHGLLWAVMRTRRIATEGEAAESEKLFRRRGMGRIVLATSYYLAATGLVVNLPLLGAPDWTVTLLMPMAFVLMAFIVVSAVRLGQGGSRVSRSPGPLGDKTPDSAWKLGLLYYNPADSALFVEKRFGIGYTVNFARPAAWFLFVVPLVAAIAFALVSALGT